jgi:TIGR02453 family protein
MTNDAFLGFSPKTFDFFRELGDNNNRPWFLEHKPVYEEQVLKPLKGLALALTPSFYSIDPQMDFRPQKLISRIYRDIRFSLDKTPYKKHMWISFQRPFEKQSTAWESFPGFYLEVGTEGINYGMGLWAGKKKIMDRVREQIAYEPKHFQEITEDLLKKYKYTIGGEEYKRAIPNELPEYFQAWMQKKSIHLYKNIPLGKKLYSKDLVSLLEQEFKALKPLYEFLADICD